MIKLLINNILLHVPMPICRLVFMDPNIENKRV